MAAVVEKYNWSAQEQSRFVREHLLPAFKNHGARKMNQVLVTNPEWRKQCQSLGQRAIAEYFVLLMEHADIDLETLKGKVGTKDYPWSILPGKEGSMPTASLSALVGLGHDLTNHGIKNKSNHAARMKICMDFRPPSAVAATEAKTTTSNPFGASPFAVGASLSASTSAKKKSVRKKQERCHSPKAIPRHSPFKQAVAQASFRSSSKKREAAFGRHRPGLEEVATQLYSRFGEQAEEEQMDDTPSFSGVFSEESSEEEREMAATEGVYTGVFTQSFRETDLADSMGGNLAIDGVRLKDSKQIEIETPLPDVTESFATNRAKVDDLANITVDQSGVSKALLMQRDNHSDKEKATRTKENVDNQLKFREAQIAHQQMRADKAAKEEANVDVILAQEVTDYKSLASVRTAAIDKEYKRAVDEAKTEYERMLKEAAVQQKDALAAEALSVTAFEEEGRVRAANYKAECQKVKNDANYQIATMKTAISTDLSQVQARLKCFEVGSDMVNAAVDIVQFSGNKEDCHHTQRVAAYRNVLVDELQPLMKKGEYGKVASYDATTIEDRDVDMNN